MAASLVSLISKKIIKPSIPTPYPLRSHKLSFIDQLCHCNIPNAFFYPKTTDKPNEPTHVSKVLEKSLSKTLSLYYPYAGRLMKDGLSVDCNDMGIELSHVRFHCPMSDSFKQPYTNYNIVEHAVFPKAQPYKHNEGNLAIAQVSYFDCGGIAVSGCLSHKIGDGCTSSNFFYDWGVLSRDIFASPTLSPPHFVGESIYPNYSNLVISTLLHEEEQIYPFKRFVFPVAKLNALKAKIIAQDKSGVQNPTRTEIVSSLLYKCALAARKESHKASWLLLLADMRTRLNPPLSQNASGNIFSIVPVGTTNNEYPTLISKMRKGKEKLHKEKNRYVEEVVESLDKGKRPYDRNEVDNYWCSSLLGCPMYKTDFGWGKPARVSFPAGFTNRFFFLLDNQTGGGIEALVILDEHDMSIFERNPELLEFANPVPNQ